MIHTKFLHNNYKVVCDYDKNVCFLNTRKKLEYISPLLEIINYEHNDCYPETKLYCKMEKDTDINTYNKYIKWDNHLCNMAYKHMLALSSSMKIKKFNKSINKYIISNKWKHQHYIKNNTLMYRYNKNEKKNYTKVEKELFLKEHGAKLIFSNKFVSNIKNLLLDDKNGFIQHFIKKEFHYDEDVSLINNDILKLLLNKMTHNNKVEFIILLLDNNVPVYVKQKLQFLSIQLEMNREYYICYVNTNWKELEKIIF
jgi:hypothetical protein